MNKNTIFLFFLSSLSPVLCDHEDDGSGPHDAYLVPVYFVGSLMLLLIYFGLIYTLFNYYRSRPYRLPIWMFFVLLFFPPSFFFLFFWVAVLGRGYYWSDDFYLDMSSETEMQTPRIPQSSLPA